MLTLARSFFDDPGATQSVLLVAGLACLTTWLLLRLRRRSHDRASQPTVHEQVERNQQIRGMHNDLETLMTEIEQFAKRLGAQLDAKAATVEKLLRDAEAKIEELRRLEQSQAGRATEPTTPPKSPSAAQVKAPTRTRPRGQAAAAATTTPTLPDTAAVDAVAQRVYALADAGHDPAAIAKRLDEHIGKVELILALRETK